MQKWEMDVGSGLKSCMMAKWRTKLTHETWVGLSSGSDPGSWVGSSTATFFEIETVGLSLVLSSDYGFSDIDTLEINAPYILSLTIKGEMCLEELLLQNVSSLVKAYLNYWVSYRSAERDQEDVEEELLQGLLSSLGHVNEIALGGYKCLQALARLEAKGFQFRKGSDLISLDSYLGGYRIFSLIHD